MGLDSAAAGAGVDASGAGGEAGVDVEVVRSIGPGAVLRCRLVLARGSAVADALRGAAARWAAAEGGGPAHDAREGPPLVAVWGRRCALDRPLRSGDRVEWLRPLQVDPKESRRLRYRGTSGGQGGIERGRGRG